MSGQRRAWSRWLDVAFLVGMLAVIAYCALAIWANVQDPASAGLPARRVTPGRGALAPRPAPRPHLAPHLAHTSPTARHRSGGDPETTPGGTNPNKYRRIASQTSPATLH